MSRNPKIALVRGDLTAQRDVDAIVNAANTELLPGGVRETLAVPDESSRGED